ncbi:MAG: sulfurtransferase TusA family protein [Magnetococcales bacterium]|nr:sulfurtransferase TusA family protein [Magnetococcales bacterium]
MPAKPSPPLPDPSNVVEVDARRLLCPLPLLRATSALERLPPATLLRLRATDPGIVQDLPAWCQVNGHQLLSLDREGGEWLGLIRKAAGPS